MTATTTPHELDAGELKVTGVKVFTDRAEVRRLVKRPLSLGINEIALKKLCPNMRKESFRVEGRGQAIIHNVTLKDQTVVKTRSNPEKVSLIREAITEENIVLKSINDRKTVIENIIEHLEKVFGKMGNKSVDPMNGQMTVSVKEGLDRLSEFFEYYENNSEKYKEKLRVIQKERRGQEEKVQKLQEELNRELVQDKFHTIKVAVISLECLEESEVELDVIYQVNNAGWSPSYDIRVDTEKPSMNITYFGKIHQNTSENWVNAPLILSTAQPSLGGKIPELGTLDAVFHQKQQVTHRSSPHVGFECRGHAPASALFSQQNHPAPQSMMFHQHPSPPPPMQVAVASEIKQNTLSTEFTILRPATIPNGTSDHKVTIGIVDLQPTLLHESVPSKNPAAFLTASAVNTSELAFLEGDSSIYLNNGFVSKSQFKNVSPGERFICSLGVDTAIRVEYKPANTYHKEEGYITKHSAIVTEQVVAVKNTRSKQPVLLTIKHQVPRSTSERIGVNLVSPVASPYDPNKTSDDFDEPEEGARLNSSNNLEWTVKLPPNSSQDLAIKYVVEYPNGEQVKFQEKK